MNMEQLVFAGVIGAWLLTAVQGAWSLVHGVRFYREVTRRLAAQGELRDGRGEFLYQPRAVVVLPCCGVDEHLERTVAALDGQRYDNFEVIFTFESADDEAFAAVGRWARTWEDVSWRRVTAGQAEGCSQKIHNLLAAIAQAPASAEVFVFLDSDAVPPPDWLGCLVAPLQDPQVGAATGFRWYTATGGVTAGVRSAWNASTLSMMDSDRTSFCWGGSTAILRKTFDALEIGRKWRTALSDDYQVTRAVRNGQLKIRFVPQALLTSAEQTTWGRFWEFARRQLIITRVCAPVIWWAGMALCGNFVFGTTVLFTCVCLGLLGWYDWPALFWATLAGWLSLLMLAGGKALTRQLAVRRILRQPHVSWRDLAWDVFAVGPIGALHMALLITSATSRRLVWRNIVYELVSADETRVLGRVGEEAVNYQLSAVSQTGTGHAP